MHLIQRNTCVYFRQHSSFHWCPFSVSLCASCSTHPVQSIMLSVYPLGDHVSLPCTVPYKTVFISRLHVYNHVKNAGECTIHTTSHSQIYNAEVTHCCVRLHDTVLICCVKFADTVCIMQMTTTVLVIRAWTALSVVHLVVDLRAIRVHSTSRVPAASSVRRI